MLAGVDSPFGAGEATRLRFKKPAIALLADSPKGRHADEQGMALEGKPGPEPGTDAHCYQAADKRIGPCCDGRGNVGEPRARHRGAAAG